MLRPDRSALAPSTWRETESLQVVVNAYDAWAERDFVEVLCMFDPQVQLHYEHDGLPYRGDFVGREALAGIVRDILSDWAFLEVTPFAFAVHNGLIAVLGRYEGEGKVTHFPFVDRFVHLWEVPGERAVRFATYRSAAQAMRDLDRSPWTPPA